MPRILATWTRKGIKVKQHLSSPRKGAVGLMELRAHSDRCQTLPDELPDDMDLMIEAKDKEQAVLVLFFQERFETFRYVLLILSAPLIFLDFTFTESTTFILLFMMI